MATETKVYEAPTAGKIGRAAVHSEVAESSETEPLVEEGLEKTLSHAANLAARWEKKNREQSVVKWLNPLAPREKQKLFDKKGECQQEIDTEYKHMKTLAKMDNRPYTPKKVMVSPKRTIEDLTDPRASQAHAAAVQVAGEIRRIGEKSKKASGVILSAGIMVAMTEGLSIPRVPELSDVELKSLCHQAPTMGKTRLAVAARKEAAKRGLKVLRF